MMAKARVEGGGSQASLMLLYRSLRAPREALLWVGVVTGVRHPRPRSARSTKEKDEVVGEL